MYVSVHVGQQDMVQTQWRKEEGSASRKDGRNKSEREQSKLSHINASQLIFLNYMSIDIIFRE